MKRKWNSSDATVQQKCVDEVIARIDELDGATPGIIATQDIIDIVTENLAPEIYNKGIRDAKKLIRDKLGDIDIELETLEQS